MEGILFYRMTLKGQNGTSTCLNIFWQSCKYITSDGP